MSKSKKKPFVFHAFACVGSNGKPFVCEQSPFRQIVGRLEIYISMMTAKENAISPAHVRKCRIEVEQ